ncbi:hypothetical protein WA538_004774, partial [Blastocystis sp. DL]
MANTLKKDSVVFIDEVDGYNSGVNVDKLKEVLRKVGITVANSYSSSVTHFVYCLSTDDMERSTVQSEYYGPHDDIVDLYKRQHAERCRHAIEDGKAVISVERLTALVNSLRAQIGYACIKHASFLEADAHQPNMQQMIVIRDGTKHYKPVSLDPSQYTPPLFNRECPAGISPFIPQELWKQFHEELRRKLLNLRADAQARKEGRLPESCWRETYLKKSVRKKQAKVRTCELCRVQFNNYLQHVFSPQHRQSLASPNYLPFLANTFYRLQTLAWRNAFLSAMKRLPPAEPVRCMRALFPAPDSEPLSPCFSSLSTETADLADSLRDANCATGAVSATSSGTWPSGASTGSFTSLDSEPRESSVFASCRVATPGTTTLLFPRFYSFVQSAKKPQAFQREETLSLPSVASSPMRSESLGSRRLPRKQRRSEMTPLLAEDSVAMTLMPSALSPAPTEPSLPSYRLSPLVAMPFRDLADQVRRKEKELVTDGEMMKPQNRQV